MTSVTFTFHKWLLKQWIGHITIIVDPYYHLKTVKSGKNVLYVLTSATPLMYDLQNNNSLGYLTYASWWLNASHSNNNFLSRVSYPVSLTFKPCYVKAYILNNYILKYDHGDMIHETYPKKMWQTDEQKTDGQIKPFI